MLTINNLLISYSQKKPQIKSKISEFERFFKNSSNEMLFEELAFCILTAGASAKMGLNAINHIKNILQTATEKQLAKKLRGVYRFPNIRSKYIIHTRDYLQNSFNSDIKNILHSYKNHQERRKFFALNKDIKGIGPKESSHYLRNIGYKGYAILDKHILHCLYELKVIKSPKPPNSLKNYIKIENSLKNFSVKHNIDFDELDLLLWSEKTGEILK